MKRVIWIISEGSPGHVSQSVGLAEALAAQVPATIRQFECRPRSGGIVRGFIRRFWMGKLARPLPDWMLRHWLRLERPARNEPSPDLIIASGGKSVFAARTLATKHGVPLIFLGERKPYLASWFHTTFSPSSFDTEANDVRMDVIPTKITPQIIQQAAAGWGDRPGGRLWTMMIGGSSRSHHYQTGDWEQLAEGMTELARREDIRWLVTTSRRSGLELEAQLRDLLPPAILADAVWWCRQPDKKLTAFLGASEKLWVTQDSVSMVTEAVASEKPTIVIYPVVVEFPLTSFMPGYLDNLEKLGLILRLPMNALPEFELQPAAEPDRPVLTTDVLAGIARERLGWS
ncbi:MAG: ELM1/GtrOC1 family putative glycosyltransferase [Verrucomicrobiota bacterium]